jgi:predicted nucleic acid-binding protein
LARSFLELLAGQRVYIDTNVFIYFLSRHPTYFESSSLVFNACADSRIFGFTGDAAVAEVMVGAYKNADPTLATRFKLFFSQKNFLTIAAHDAQTFDAAAQLVAMGGVKFIDALHMATAVQNQCAYFVTNDKGIKSGAHLKVVQLEQLLAH